MKIGDYVRTKEGKIINIQVLRKVKDLEFVPFPITNEFIEINYKYMNKKDIIKSSPNIIDLIEVGDLITLTSKYCKNEVYRVIHTFKDNNDSIIELDCFQDGTMFISKSEDIKSIVTKEQFSSMEYKINDSK